MTATEVRDVAIAGVEAGISVVPPRQNGTKAPITEKINGEDRWEHWQKTPPTREQVEAWYSDGRRTGVGFVGGKVSGGLELFEFEGRAADAGIIDRFIDLAEQRGLSDLVGLLFTGYLEESPSGGIHILYRCTETACIKLAKTADGKDLIETKGEGGYMIVAPTNGQVHPNGGTWEMLRGGIDTIPIISPEQRRRLLELAAYFDERPPPGDETPAAPGQFTAPGRDGWVSQVIADYNQRTTWTEVLAGRFAHVHDRGGIGYWHYEGADNVISATTNATGRDTLIVFSGTAEGAGWRIWEGRGKASSYDRFSAHVLIETGRHDTDTRVEIAGKLQAEGYGPSSRHQPAGTPPDNDDLWIRRPWLGHIRQAAHARCVSAPAVLTIVLARAAALAPHTLRLPATVGGRANLALIAAVTGPPGSSKSSANAVARELLPAPTLAAADGLPVVADQLPLGSGEGLVEVLFGTVEIEDGGKKRQERQQVRHQAFVYIDEGEALVRLGQRDGATVLPTLRSIWSAQPIGNANANRDRRRVVPGDNYTYGIVVALQPAKAGDLLGDADGGTPARVLWADAVDAAIPDEPPDWPGPIDWKPPAAKIDHVLAVDPTIADELRSDRRAVARGETTVDPLDAHAGLMRLKVAALAALLDGHEHVTPDDWDLAGSIMRASDTTRSSVIAVVNYQHQLDEQRSRERHARRETEADTATRRTHTVDGARKIANKVWAQPDRWTARTLYGSVSRWVREIWDDALDHALAEGWVTEVTGPGQGADKRSLHPGENRP